ncbi:threonine/serine exporter family protein [Ornithinimicrobium sp. Arc0846-15]|nr:threonine/serine exporter family protein [Ornithinimicrobium laminariae]
MQEQNVSEEPIVGATEITGPQLRPAPSIGKAWRDRASWAVRGLGPPTVPIGVPSTSDDISQQHARLVIDLALRVGEALLSTGASAADVVTTVLRLTAAYGIHSTHVDITFTSISVSIQRGANEDPLSVMRVVKVRSADYSRLEELYNLVEEIAFARDNGHEVIEVEDARQQLSDILVRPHPHRRWVATAGLSCIAVGVTWIFGAGPVMWIVAAISAALVDQTQRFSQKIGLAGFFANALSASIPTFIAAGLTALGSAMGGIPGLNSPSVVVVSGIIVLLAGLSVLGAAQDAIDGYYLTSAARGIEVLMMTLGIGIGTALALQISTALGVGMSISPYVTLGGSPLFGTLGAMLVALGFSLATYTGVRATMLGIALSGAAWILFELVSLFQFSIGPTVAIPAVVVGFAGYYLHRQLRVPELAITTAAIISLLPGLAVYKGLFLLMEDSEAGAYITAIYVQFSVVIGTGIGLAAGLSIGAYLARKQIGTDRSAIRARRRGVGAY